jgi:hypothetical protein
MMAAVDGLRRTLLQTQEDNRKWMTAMEQKMEHKEAATAHKPPPAKRQKQRAARGKLPPATTTPQ